MLEVGFAGADATQVSHGHVEAGGAVGLERGVRTVVVEGAETDLAAAGGVVRGAVGGLHRGVVFVGRRGFAAGGSVSVLARRGRAEVLALVVVVEWRF